MAKNIIEERTNIDLDKKLSHDIFHDIADFFENFTAHRNQFDKGGCEASVQPVFVAGSLSQTSSVAGSSSIDRKISYSKDGLSDKCKSNSKLPCWFESGQRCCPMRK